MSFHKLSLPENSYQSFTLTQGEFSTIVEIKTDANLPDMLMMTGIHSDLVSQYLSPINGEYLTIPVANGEITPSNEILQAVASILAIQRDGENIKTAVELIILAYTIKSFAKVLAKVGEIFESINEELSNPNLEVVD